MNLEWIDIKTDKPKYNGSYLIYGSFTRDCPKEVTKAYWIKNHFVEIGIKAKNVTHWMPLPPKP